ncbi:hypothetical protein ACQ4M4_27310 [Leptolyngbya sp. AN02str]|uniref:hypothetical protein n=1 Tax=Leptolyngbya sp. AN02str TaxID=3423363 RepID=UPI003D31F417
MKQNPQRTKHKRFTRYDALSESHITSMLLFAAFPLLFGERFIKFGFLAIVLINLPIIWWAVRDSFLKAQQRKALRRKGGTQAAKP